MSVENPLDNNDLATKQYTDENIGMLGEDLRKIIAQSNNCRLTRGQTALTKFLSKFCKKLKLLRTIYLNM